MHAVEDVAASILPTDDTVPKQTQYSHDHGGRRDARLETHCVHPSSQHITFIHSIPFTMFLTRSEYGQ